MTLLSWLVIVLIMAYLIGEERSRSVLRWGMVLGPLLVFLGWLYLRAFRRRLLLACPPGIRFEPADLDGVAGVPKTLLEEATRDLGQAGFAQQRDYLLRFPHKTLGWLRCMIHPELRLYGMIALGPDRSTSQPKLYMTLITEYGSERLLVTTSHPLNGFNSLLLDRKQVFESLAAEDYAELAKVHLADRDALAKAGLPPPAPVSLEEYARLQLHYWNRRCEKVRRLWTLPAAVQLASYGEPRPYRWEALLEA